MNTIHTIHSIHVSVLNENHELIDALFFYFFIDVESAGRLMSPPPIHPNNRYSPNSYVDDRARYSDRYSPDSRFDDMASSYASKQT